MLKLSFVWGIAFVVFKKLTISFDIITVCYIWGVKIITIKQYFISLKKRDRTFLISFVIKYPIKRWKNRSIIWISNYISEN